MNVKCSVLCYYDDTALLSPGLQQYLFESGRIDNIFGDYYYERFTECLNELLTKYEPKLNHTGIISVNIELLHGNMGPMPYRAHYSGQACTIAQSGQELGCLL